MLYGIPGCSDRATAYLSALTYWIFSCRDAKRSPAKGLDTWTYLQKAIEQAAIPAANLDRYQALLADKLVVAALYPKRFVRIISNPQSENVILFGVRSPGGTPTDLRELSSESQERILIAPGALLEDLRVQGIGDRQILQLAKPTRLGGIPHVIGMYCQVAHEEYKYKPPEEEEALEVEAFVDV